MKLPQPIRALLGRTSACVLSDLETASAFFEPFFAGISHELLVIAELDLTLRLVGKQMLPGDRTTVAFDLELVMRKAFADGARAMIVAHNHPQGIAAPSKEDMLVTRDIALAGRVVGIRLIDHLIFASDGRYSFRESGLM